MKHNETITNWIAGLGDGNERSVEILFNTYFERLIRLAVRKMHGLNTVARSGEDIAISAIKSLCFRVKDKEISFSNENDLWGCLFRITTRKACAERRKSFAARRGKNVQAVSGSQPGDDSDDAIFNYVAGHEPPPELAIQLAENADELLSLFKEAPTQYTIASLKLQGLTVPEIAEQVGLMPRTIFWHLNQMQRKWELFKQWEYLVDSLFDGLPLDKLAQGLDWDLQTLEPVVNRMLELWEVETGDRNESQILRLLFFKPAEYTTMMKSNSRTVEEVEQKLGLLRRGWMSLVLTRWKSELEGLLKKIDALREHEKQ